MTRYPYLTTLASILGTIIAFILLSGDGFYCEPLRYMIGWLLFCASTPVWMIMLSDHIDLLCNDQHEGEGKSEHH